MIRPSSLLLAIGVASIPAVGRAQCNAAPPAAGRLLTYAFDPVVSPAATVLHVTLAFTGNAEGIESLELPSHWVHETTHAVSNLRVVSTGATLLGESDARTRTVRFSANAPVVVTYDLAKDWDGPLVSPRQFDPVVMPEYFEINGDNALVHPTLDGDVPVTAIFDWRHLPANWTLATSFGGSANADDRCQSFTGHWRAVEDAVFAAGDFRIHRFQIGRRDAVLAIRGQWTFTDDAVVTDLQRVVGLVRDFWHDDDFPYFLITWKPYDTDHGSGDGSGFTNAFWIYMSRLDSLSTQLTQISHEAFHAWNTRRLSTSAARDPNIGWFHEGFTTYYADVLVARAGLLSLPTYVKNTNRDLRQVATSASPYVRGRVIALWLDGEIRRRSNNAESLDDVMFALRRDAAAPLTQARILETIDRFVSPDVRRRLELALPTGGSVPVPDDAALGPCAHVSVDTVPTFDLGFDLAASRAARRVIGVKPDGPAFVAGLRDGQVLVGSSVYMDHPDTPAKITVLADNARRVIEYYPRGPSMTAPQFHLDSDASADRCRPR